MDKGLRRFQTAGGDLKVERKNHRSGSSGRWAGLVWALLLPLVARTALGQVPPPPATSDFDVVQVDLNGQTFNRVLPFDVPFIFAGNVPAGITELQVRCWQLGTTKGTKGVKPDVVAGKEPLGKPADGDCWEGKVPTWHNTIDPAAPNPQFRVLVPRLEAERYYQFKFSFTKTVTAQQAADFAQQVAGIVDAALWGDPAVTVDLPVSGDLTTQELEQIRDRLILALRQVTGADRIVQPGTIFSDDAALDKVRDELNGLLNPVRTAQGQIHATLENYQDEIANLNASLQTLRTDATLKKLRDALASRATADPSAQDHADEVAAALAVADAPVLLNRDRQSAAAVAAFAQKNAAYFADASAKIAKLRDLLANKLVTADGSPQPFLAPLVSTGQSAAGQLSTADVTALVAMGQPRGLVGSVDRALARTGQNMLQGQLSNLLANRAKAVAAIAQEYRTRVEGMIVIAGSTTGSFATQSNNYISADTGVVCAPALSDCTTYAGTNIYFRPINKAAPLSQFGNFFQTLDRRLSLTMGLTVQGIGDDKTREDLFNNQSLVLGLGARLTNSVRLTGGALVFKELDPNPLVDDPKLTTTYFFSLSFDIDVVPALKGIGGLFKP
ncbi:MAG: hypothetical protein QOF89_5668 [Acidobacteriota bacterium]|nr:hypothetical protein [Acidobacteriota bacterium]